MTDVQITEVPVEVAEEAVEEAVAPPIEPAELEPSTAAPKKRGRPVGSKNRAKPPDPPPLERSPEPAPPPLERSPEPAPAPKPKRARAKPKAKTQREPSPDSEPELPGYVQQALPPPQPQDLAAALMSLMQTHERERTGRKRAQYASWVSRF